MDKDELSAAKPSRGKSASKMESKNVGKSGIGMKGANGLPKVKQLISNSNDKFTKAAKKTAIKVRNK